MIIELRTNDNQTVSVSKDDLKDCRYIYNYFERKHNTSPVSIVVEDDDRGHATPSCSFDLPIINSKILEKVLEFIYHHNGDPLSGEEQEETSCLDTWNDSFCKELDQKTLFELIKAANFLGHQYLLDVTCKFVANMIKGKTPTEIRSTFNIQNDFTIDEENLIKDEIEWVLNG